MMKLHSLLRMLLTAMIVMGLPVFHEPLPTTIYLPAISRLPKLELHGYILEQDIPIADLPVSLQKTYFRPLFTTLVTTTLTGPDGMYNFTAVETLVSCDDNPYCMAAYTVVYSDKRMDTQRLSNWVTPAISNYPQGQFLNLGCFDIAAPVLITPTHGVVVNPTFLAKWERRSEQSDSYQIVIWGDQLSFESDELGYVEAYTITLGSAFYHLPLQWAVRIHTTGGEGITHPEQFSVSELQERLPLRL